MEQRKRKMNGKNGGGDGWCSCCGYGGGQKHWHPGFFVLRIIVAIMIVVIAFAVGMKLGEIKTALYYSGYGYSPRHSMMWGFNGGYGMPMMQYLYSAQNTTSGAQLPR